MLDVEFEWFDPSEIDFLGIKGLLKQLFDSDNILFELSTLTDLILKQPLLGSTVKVDGKESDPYAFLTVLNLHEHRANPVIAKLKEYLREKSQGDKILRELLGGEEAQVGLILAERFINMPSETIPPMYSMLLEEIQWAIEEHEPYQFSHYLILSRNYIEIESSLPNPEAPERKKKKKDINDKELFYFHPEDEKLKEHALASIDFNYSNEQDEGASDSKRAFQDAGIRPQGSLICIEAAKLEGAVQAIKAFIGGS
jgi:protein BCP1